MKKFISVLGIIGVVFTVLGLNTFPGLALVATTELVSVSINGSQGNAISIESSISADGRYVAFSSQASDLVENDTNGVSDIFVRDLENETTTRVSVSSEGVEGNDDSRYPAISADGRFVAFSSSASNLVPGDTVGTGDVFLHDLITGETTWISKTSYDSGGSDPTISADGRFIAFQSNHLLPEDSTPYTDIYLLDRSNENMSIVSVASDGMQGSWLSYYPDISADGRFIVFTSGSVNLVPGDTNGVWDVFVHDTLTGETVRASQASDGTQGNGGTQDYPKVSDDGRFVAFISTATNLVPNDNNNLSDIFVHNLDTRETVRVSVSTTGEEGNDYSSFPDISSDGRFVSFRSDANNLVLGDINPYPDIFIHDTVNETTELVSLAYDNTQRTGMFTQPVISSDARFISFTSQAANLVPNDTNAVQDVVIRNVTNITTPPTPTPTFTPTPTSCDASQFFISDQWDMINIDVPGALAQFPGCNTDPIRIAVIDTGIALYHPDIAMHINSLYSPFEGEEGIDKNGHGTHVAGIIGAIQNNNLGISGIHPNPEIAIYQSSIKGPSDNLTLANLIKKAVDDKVRIINLSSGNQLGDPFGVLENAIKYAQNSNPPVIIVASAAELNPKKPNTDPAYPAYYALTYDNVIAVTASTINNVPSSYIIPGNYISIAAPGGQGVGKNLACSSKKPDCVWSLWLKDGEKEIQGTSMAAPHVTGVIALMLSANSDLTPSQVKRILILTSKAFSQPSDNFAGHGIVDARKAVECAKKPSDVLCGGTVP